MPPIPFWMTGNEVRSHFSPFQINTQLFIFFISFSQNGCRRPFWMTENHFWSHFSPFQINTQLLFVWILFTKWLPAAILDDQQSLSIAFLAISDQYATFIFYFVHKMGAGDHFGLPKITFDHISRHFKSIRNFFLFWFCSQNGCRRPFWMTENHFLSHFSPFQINTQLWLFLKSSFQINTQLYLFFTKWPFWMTENHFWSHFSPFQINTQLFFSKWPPVAILEVRFAPETIGFFHYVLSMAMPNMKLIGELMTQLEMPQAFWTFFIQNGRQRPFCFSDWCQKS